MPERRWSDRDGQPTVEITLKDPAGTSVIKAFFVDTGNPLELIIDHDNMVRFKLADAPDVLTNFGRLQGGWVWISIPELGIEKYVVGYATSLEDFDILNHQGLVGLPFLREFDS